MSPIVVGLYLNANPHRPMSWQTRTLHQLFKCTPLGVWQCSSLCGVHSSVWWCNSGGDEIACFICGTIQGPSPDLISELALQICEAV